MALKEEWKALIIIGNVSWKLRCAEAKNRSAVSMVDCDQSLGEFTRSTRNETDYFRHQLRTVIIEADVAAYGMACARKDYDALIGGGIPPSEPAALLRAIALDVGRSYLDPYSLSRWWLRCNE